MREFVFGFLPMQSSRTMMTFRNWIAADGVVLIGGILSATVMVRSMIMGWHRALLTRGRYASISIEAGDAHPLVLGGRYVKKLYLSNRLGIVRLPFVSGSLSGPFPIVFVYAAMLVFRLGLEKETLNDKLGRSVQSYKGQMPRVVPKVF